MQGQFIEVNGYRTHYFDEGEGPIVVLMHGASIAIDAWLTWHGTITHLSTNFRVVAFDQPGFGRTDMPKDGHYLNRLLRTDHALAFLDRLGVERAILVGHSWGGAFATAYALAFPERTAGLVLLSAVTHPWPGDPGWYNNLASLRGIGPLFLRTLVYPLGSFMIDGVEYAVPFWIALKWIMPIGALPLSLQTPGSRFGP